MAEEKKLTTAEILARARKQDQGQGAPKGEVSSSAEAPAGQSAAPESPTVPSKPATTPKSTADILAAARAEKQGGGASAQPPAAKAASKNPADILAAARAQGAASSAKPKGGEAPKSTADILAAARAGGGGSGAAAKAPAAGSESASKSGASKVSVGDRPPLKDMVAAVKAAGEGKPAVRPKMPVAAKPKLPSKPEKVSRRSVLGALTAITVTPFAVAWALMAGIGGLWSLAIARFMMPNMVLELPSQFKVGPPSDFPPGTVSEKFKASRGIWIVRSDQYNGEDMIYALASVCTHLGCTPNWLEGEQKFKCPCHGSGFYISGINFEGPAPRPLERVGLRRADDGMLEVDKSLKFQEELGQWSDPKSFLPVA